MKVNLTAADLVAFEDEIAHLFSEKHCLFPVHLAGGNERQLIEVFENHVEPDDWICCTWRSHYHCLLKGVASEELRQAILDGKGISLSFPKHRIISSAIVGGIAPIAVGLAMGCYYGQAKRKVVCFLGDMAAETGIVLESMKYAINWKLPVKWIVEDNGKSGDADTLAVWGGPTELSDPSIIAYKYQLTRPHCGVDKWITF